MNAKISKASTRLRLGWSFALVALLAGMPGARAQTCSRVPKRDCEVRTRSAPGSLGAVLMVDEKPQGVTDIQSPPLLLAPGRHIIYVQSSGKRGSPMDVDCPSGGRVELQPSLEPEQSQGVFPWDSVLLLDDQLEAELRAALRAALTSRLETINLLTVSPDRAALADLPRVDTTPCPQLACTEVALNCLAAQWALHIQPPTPEVPDRYRLRLLDHRVWNGFSETTVTIPFATSALAVEALVTAAYDLIKNPALKPQQPVTITSVPSGAELTLNSRPAGRTPWAAHLYNEDYTVELGRSGYLPFRARLPVVNPVRDATRPAGDYNSLVGRLQLDPLRARRRSIQKGIAWSSLLTGVLSVGAGVTLLVLHGQQVDCDPTDPTVCHLQVDSQTGGIVATATGGVLIGVAGALFGVLAREPK